jgi:hypothetical protein
MRRRTFFDWLIATVAWLCRAARPGELRTVYLLPGSQRVRMAELQPDNLFWLDDLPRIIWRATTKPVWDGKVWSVTAIEVPT